MDFDEATRTIFVIFHWLGQCKRQTPAPKDLENLSIISGDSVNFKQSKYINIFKSSTKIAKCLRRMGQYMPLTLLIVLNITMTLFALCKTPRSKGKFSETNHTVAHIFVLSSFVTTSTIIVHHLMNGDLVHDIHHEMTAVQTVVNDKLQMCICFRKLRKLFFIKIGLMVGSYLQAIGMFFVGSLLLNTYTICPLAYGLSIITDISCLYAIFCIDFVQKTLAEINAVLKRFDAERICPSSMQMLSAEKDDIAATRLIEKIEVLKQMYLSAWILTQKINRSFGWFFVAYLVQQFVDLAADLFWLFLINHDDFSFKIVCE